MKRVLGALLPLLLAPSLAFAQVGTQSPVLGIPSTAGTLAISAGGTWQQVFAANPGRAELFLENYCTATSQNIASTESLFIYFGPTAPSGNPWTLGAVELAACGSQTFAGTFQGGSTQLGPRGANYVPQTAVWVWGATINHAFSAWQG